MWKGKKIKKFNMVFCNQRLKPVKRDRHARGNFYMRDEGHARGNIYKLPCRKIPPYTSIYS